MTIRHFKPWRGFGFWKIFAAGCGILLSWGGAVPVRGEADAQIDFNRDIRRILSDNCFICHGPDANERKGSKGGLRLDLREGALADLGGYQAIVPGAPAESELFARITTQNAGDKMPPPELGKGLDAREIELLKKWIEQGAHYAVHWAYAKPERPELPEVSDPEWPRNGIDHFVLNRLDREGLQPAPEADWAALLRRAALDLTGLPPAPEELERVLKDNSPDAYERWVDGLLEKPAFGEHWARLWLDHARYADSAGYADDPSRTIWAFRDYVIQSFNANKPFDQFTLEQLAGDLLPDPTEEQIIATAFHRNTLTNNEGGTSDEEFRNEAVIDRVNTTLAVWMGTTMSCAQCHDHKYDPISQKDYFRLFAILNNTEDADRSDEAPVHKIFTGEQKQQRHDWHAEIAQLQEFVRTSTPELAEAQSEWETIFATDLIFQTINLSERKSKAGAAMTRNDDETIRIEREGKTDVYTLGAALTGNGELAALRLEAFPDERPPGSGVGHAGGNFVISGISAAITPPGATPQSGRYLRIQIPGEEKILSLAEVQVFQGLENIALEGEATQSSTSNDGKAARAIDGNTDGDFNKAKSTTHTETSTDPWWELDFGSMRAIDRVVLWNRTDNNLHDRLNHFQVTLLDENREPVWDQQVKEAPRPSAELSLSGARSVRFASAYADYEQKGFEAANVLNPAKDKGWAIAPEFGKRHTMTLISEPPVKVAAGSKLTVNIEQLSKYEYATVSRLRLSITTDERAFEFARTPPAIQAITRKDPEERTGGEQEKLIQYYLTIAPALEEERNRLAGLKKELDEMKPYTTVPIMRELAGEKRRKTHLQYRGNFLDLGPELSEGLPEVFFPFSNGETPNRLTLAAWLMHEENPLTARVLANHFWEAIFGIGIVRTSEEFGSQGELPFHPELLDWLATEFRARDWNLKELLKLMVTSSAYRQSARVTPELAVLDPDNRLLARGPRFRLSAEMIRDQAMFISGLLSPKLHGPPVKPPQPETGLNAAFGSRIDWETSEGEDRYRRALYTTWRRSNPYPSMATFDAPNREVCTVRRERSNTPLQALVTLNDPVYVEAAQALARRMAAAGSTPAAKARHGFFLTLGRTPSEAELTPILRLYAKTYERYTGDRETAREMATNPLGAAPEETDIAELAAWTVVGNVLLNLDETLMKR
jgi:hypothetical protein